MTFTIIAMGQTVSEQCMWVVEGRRYICISYYYNAKEGELYYAATIYKAPHLNYSMTPQEIENHEHTTTQRYNIRPAMVYTFKNMGYEELIKNIRYQMIHGPGCKGPRTRYNPMYDEVSEDSFLSNPSSISEHGEHSEHSDSDISLDGDYEVSDNIFKLKTIKHFM